MDRIQAVFQDDPSNDSLGAGSSGQAGSDGGVEEDDEEYDERELENEEVEFVQVNPGEEIKSDKDQFWDEFFDSLMLTVPFTFLYLLLDM